MTTGDKGARSKTFRTTTAFVIGCGIARFAILAFGQETAVVRDLREDWDLATVRSELSKLGVQPEIECSEGTISDGWGGREPEIESLHGGPFSPYDGLCFPNYHYVDIEHIVARKESDESGMCNRPLTERERFAVDLLNLTFAPSSLNASKGKLDAGDLSTAEDSLFRDELTAEGKCFWAAQTVRVKSKYGLSVDEQERNALNEILANCATEQTLVGRPAAPPGCGWMIRPEFAAAVADTPNVPTASCSEEPSTQSWYAALQFADEIACIVGLEEHPEDDVVAPSQPNPTGVPNPRASQVEAQKACKAKLERITCGAIKEQCPSVGVIHRGEPLYQAKGTNGRSNDSDDDGLYCESL